MTRQEVLSKISHYEWMLESLELADLHRYWIVGQLQELKATLGHKGEHTDCAYCEAGIAEQHLAERASK